MEEYKAKVIWEYGRCKGQLLVDISEQAKLLGQPHKWMAFDLEYKEPFTENPFLVISRKSGEWIPCSERLPKRNELVIASLATGIQLCEYVEDRTSDEWFSLIDNCYVWNKFVKAWMPLPEPYKEGDPDA